MPSRMLAAVAALVALFATWLAIPQVAIAADTSPSAAVTYTYAGHPSTIQAPYSTTERGPPTNYDYAHHGAPVNHGSHNALARSSETSTAPTTTDTARAFLARAAEATPTTRGHAEVVDGDLSSLQGSQVAANSGRVVANACRTNSFTGDTLVLMADGSRKPIKDVKLGDEVIATDPETGESGPRKVTDLIRHGGLHTMVALRLSDGSTIDATDQHPFWVESRGEWVDAIDLRPGDIVLTADGHRLTVASLGISEQDLTAYNLTVADLHTYFAGESAVLVHNTGCTNIADLPASAVRNLTEDSGYAFSRLSQNHGVSRIEFREQIHMIKRNENLPADFNLSFGPTGDVWNPRTGELIGSIVHGG